MSDINLPTIETPLDRRRVGDMTIERFGGLTFTEYREAVEFAKIVCQARNGIPAYLKQNVGDCLIIITQALRFDIEACWMLQHSYVTKPDSENSLIAYDSAVHAAIVLSKGRLQGRPKYSFSGEGEERRCTVTAKFIGDDESYEYTTPPIRQCRPPRGDKGYIKGSPLWEKDPDQQLGYYAMRNWGRRHCPDILGGVYDRDEFESSTQEPDAQVMPPSPNLMDRLPGRMSDNGFKPDVVTAGLADPAPRAKKGRRKAEAAPANIVPPAETAPSEPATQAAGPSIPVPDATHADADSPAASPTSGTGAIERIPESADEYIVYAEHWISQCPHKSDAYQRWDQDMELRDNLKVPITDRNALLRQIEETFGART
jgi:hypothetical protein